MATQQNIDIESIRARAKKAGLTVEQLREIVAGLSRPDVLTRARESGLSVEEIKAMLGAIHEHPY